MRTKRILSLFTAIAIVMTLLTSFGVAEAASVIKECESYTTTQGGDYYSLDLDELFETGRTYEITWNMKPAELNVSNALGVDMADSDVAGLGQYGLFYLYDNSDNALGMGDWNKIGYIPGQKAGIAESGIDFKLVWDTEAGTANFDVMFPQSGGYEPMTKSMTWEPGVIDGNYGSLKLGADGTTVTITDLTVTKFGADVGEPTERYDLMSYETTGANDWLLVNLDNVFKTGEKYEISFNVKPDGWNGADLAVTLADSDAASLQYGMLYVYESGNHAIVGDTYGGYVLGFKDNMISNGVDVTMIWDTSTGAITGDVWFAHGSAYPDAEHKAFTYNTTAINGAQSYGFLKIGAPNSGVTIKNLKIKNVNVEPTEKYDLLSYKTEAGNDWLDIDLDDIFKTGEKYEISFKAKPTAWNGTDLAVTLLDSDVATPRFGLVYIYENGNHALVGDTYADGVGGFKGSMVENGVDVTMIWDTSAGTIDLDVWFAHGTAWPSVEHKTFTYNVAAISDSQKYGCLRIGAPDSAVIVKNVKIKNINAEPEGSYELASYETDGANDWLAVDLDDVFETGESYKISLNVKPNEIGSNPLRVALTDGDLNKPTTGLVNHYTEGTSLHALGADSWSNGGGLDGFKEDILANGIDMTFMWDTATGVISCDVWFAHGSAWPEAEHKTFTWEAGVTGEAVNYGNLKIGSTSNAVSISDLKITKDIQEEEPQPVIYTKEKGWTLNGGIEQADGSLKVPTNTAGATVFKPALEAGKKYSITYDVTGLTTGDEWAYPFRVNLAAGEENVEGVLSYRMSSTGRWNDSETDRLVAEGTNGKNEIVIYTATGEWEAYALGNLSKSGTFADVSDFTIKFYQWAGYDAYISNVTITELGDPIYTEENGWTVQDGAEQADGTLRVPLNTNGSAIFKPTLEAGKKYSITYDVTGLTTGDEWAYPFIVDLSAGEEVAEKVLSYRMSSAGRWNNIETDALVAEGTDGKNEIVIDTATGDWETYALGNLSVSGTFAIVNDFSIKFYQWAGYPAYISNVQVKEISQTVAAPVVKAQSITFEKYDGEKSAMSSIVYAGTKQITIDFGTKMNFSSLNAESVVLKEKESGNVIAYGADRTATAYKMIFDNLLKPGCSYVLTISGTVANASDITLGETATFEFTTDEGDYKFTLKGISVGDNSNPTISDVVNSNSFTTNIGVINSTGITKDMLLITTYYKGDRLLYAKYDIVELDESYINTIVKRESNTVVPEGTDNIRIFLWDQFNTMNPYDTELVIK